MAVFAPSWKQEHTLEAVLDSISDGVLTYDRDLQITGMNRAAAEILGCSAGEIVGGRCRDVFRCGVCEPGCGFEVALANKQTVANTTVRLKVKSAFTGVGTVLPPNTGQNTITPSTRKKTSAPITTWGAIALSSGIYCTSAGISRISLVV